MNLKALREERRLTQEEVGKILGLSESMISKHESGERKLSPASVEAYAKLYKVNTYELFIDPDTLPETDD